MVIIVQYMGQNILQPLVTIEKMGKFLFAYNFELNDKLPDNMNFFKYSIVSIIVFKIFVNDSKIIIVFDFSSFKMEKKCPILGTKIIKR